jgi:propionate CoA-transferase
VEKIEQICGPLRHKVYALVNNDGFEVDRELEDAYLDAVQDLGDRYFLGVTRFTTSAFMRAKLGHALEARDVAPHIFESEAEATTAVRARAPYRSEETRCRFRATHWTRSTSSSDGNSVSPSG